MNTRLIAFTLALLFLPPIALTLAELEWVAPPVLEGEVWRPALLSLTALAAFALLLDALTFRRKQHSLLRSQPYYLLWCSIAGLFVGMLLGWLNLFIGTWLSPAAEGAALLLAALGGMVLLPAILIARMWLAGLPGLVRLGTHRFALPAPTAESAAKLLLFAALGGLLAGPVWPEMAAWPFWLAPLLLLVALQLLWHESTVFSGLAQGDWSRVLLGALAGILSGGIALACYRAFGGTLLTAASTPGLLAGLALFGLISLQLGDIVAEHWRGKPRGEVFKKKTFPIPVVTKKDQ